MLKNKNIVIGISSSIACYKILDLAKKLKDLGANIYVIMTKNAAKMISPSEFEGIAKEVRTHMFDPEFNYKDYLKKDKPINHISLADIADLFLIAPATANTIGKIANGIADDLLTTSVMATLAPVVICPAMNVKMWENPIVQENTKKLRKLGYHIIDPEHGELACGYTGVGRLANLEKIANKIKTTIEKKDSLKGEKILVTAGATIEEIDPVRVITNKSSGKMGVYIAEEAFLRGANVTLIRGQNSVQPKFPINDITIFNSKQLYDKIKKNIKDNDTIIHAAAVSDFEVNNKNNKKIKSGQQLHLELQPTTKILENIKKIKNDIFLIGFKAEYNVSKNELIKRAYDLLKSAKADLIVANDVGKEGRGFDVETNEVFIVDKNRKTVHLGLESKKIIAGKILDKII